MSGLNLLDSVQSAQLLSENNRVVDVFVVSDAETKAAIPEEKWPDIKEMIFAKLKRRIFLNTAAGDPDLAEHVITFYISCLESYLRFLLIEFLKVGFWEQTSVGVNKSVITTMFSFHNSHSWQV